MKMIGGKTNLQEHPVFFGSWFFLHMKQEQKKQAPLHAKGKQTTRSSQVFLS